MNARTIRILRQAHILVALAEKRLADHLKDLSDDAIERDADTLSDVNYFRGKLHEAMTHVEHLLPEERRAK